MTLPPNIRVNVGAPFPAMVKASAPLTIQKKAGIWTVGFSFAALGTQVPPYMNLATDYLMFWDSVANVYFKVPLAQLAAVMIAVRNQRAITAFPVAIAATDQILNLNLQVAGVITLPGYATRAGAPLTFKDVGRQAAAFPILLQAAPGEFIDGQPSIPLNVAGQSITLVPANDGVNTGWSVE